ncbi:hypothetical protein CP532_6713 [Ophiocordyceps camponoti-leonardi (nom. inval.)]|nr:hypothetical protein CP532_6713 [Ophiocordyceps camponoti-leonardi (nom. inval.)]
MGPVYVLRPAVCVFENKTTCVWRTRVSNGECHPRYPIEIASNPFTQRVATTEFFSLNALCSQDTDGVNPGQDCCAAYGLPCGLRHFQELWCQPSKAVEKEKKEKKKKEEEKEQVIKKQLKKKINPSHHQSSETCTNKGKTCRWYGSSPSCGGNEKAVGAWINFNDRKRQLVITTELGSRKHVCAFNSSWFDPKSGDCCDKYGWGCVTGYKRLWCYE